MKLYYSPGACSLAPHILIEELALPYEAVPVDLEGHAFAGGDYLRVNPKGAVPAIELVGGEVLTENAVILQYLADRKPEAHALPKPGTLERYRAMEWLNYIATELHKGFTPLFLPDTPADYPEIAKKHVAEKLGYVSARLGSRPYLLGSEFSAPDAYLFVMLTWAGKMGIELAPNLAGFAARMRERPAVKRVLEAEGLGRAA